MMLKWQRSKPQHSMMLKLLIEWQLNSLELNNRQNIVLINRDNLFLIMISLLMVESLLTHYALLSAPLSPIHSLFSLLRSSGLLPM